MKWRETELSPKPHRFSLFWNTAENPFLLPPAPCGLRVLPRTRELLLSPRRSPAPFEVSDLRALLFPPAMSTPTTLGWYCRVNSSLLQKKLGEAGPESCSSQLWESLSLEGASSGSAPRTGCRMGFRRSEEPNGLGFCLQSGCSQVPGSRWAAKPFAPGPWS